MKKKVLILSATVVFLLSGSAFAWGGPGWEMMAGPPQTRYCTVSGAFDRQEDMNFMFGRGIMYGRHMRSNRRMMPGEASYGRQQMMRDDRMDGRSFFEDVEVPNEIKAKMTEMQKNRHEIALAMLEESVDKTKVRSLYEKKLTLRNELSKWWFEQRLNALPEKK